MSQPTKSTSDLTLAELPIEQEQHEQEQNGHTARYVETENEEELRSFIANVSDTIEVLLDIPEWHDKDGRIVQVLVRALQAGERSDFIENMQKVNFKLKVLYPDLAIKTARHPRTKKLIWQPADRDTLNSKIGRSLERIAMKAADISGLNEDFLNDIKKN